MPDMYIKCNGRIDRRSPADERQKDSPLLRENLLSRDSKLRKVRGTEKCSQILTDRITWAARYYSKEIGVVSPKTVVYTRDGVLSHIDLMTGAVTQLRTDLNPNAFPRSVMVKTAAQSYMYMTDEKNLWKYDGNNDIKFERVQTSFAPIGVIEHLDRLWAISKDKLFVSKNLEFDNFDDATDSLEIVVGSGNAENVEIFHILGTVYIFNTEGIFQVIGDYISAVASTFEIRKVSDRTFLRGTLQKVNNGIVGLAVEDKEYELWVFGGNAASEKKLSHFERLTWYINSTPDILKNLASGYYDSYYQLAFTEKGQTENKMEIWWDTIEDKCEFIRGRNVSCYMKLDPTREESFLLVGRSDTNYLMWTDRGHNFDDVAIRVRLLTGDATPKKHEVVRFTDFYVEVEPIGNRQLLFRYLVDSHLSELTGANSNFMMNLEGESKALGFIKISNQRQFYTRVQPKINYSLGTSIAFEIDDQTKNLDFVMYGIGIDFIANKG